MSLCSEKRIFIGIDTSCYTSSAACVCVDGILCDMREALRVNKGERGLRQSDAVFAHTRNMTELLPALLTRIEPDSIAGVGVSVCPGSREGSYMPVFLVGKLLAETLGASRGVPVMGFTHQMGHIRAALHGNEELIGKPHFAFHLSGGTSELLFVDEGMNIETLGGSSDINAGQLIDRIGVKLGLAFPAGRALEALALKASGRGVMLASSVRGMSFSLSGAETKAIKAIESGDEPEKTAYSVFDLLARALSKTVKNALTAFESRGTADFLFAGGVASSTLLRGMLEERLAGSGARLHFSKPELSSDNAVGAALLCMDRLGALQNNE